MSFMADEAREAPEAVARFLDRNARTLRELGSHLRRQSRRMVLTSARGSSDHAAGYFKYLCEILLGIPCASIGASVVSVYGASLKASGSLCLTISQSGQSPDIVALQEAVKKAHGLTVALVNDAASPAALNADICLPLHAGPERSVAATKSFIASLAAGAAVIAAWLEDEMFSSALKALPERLEAATRLTWPGFVAQARDASSLYVVGRGPCLSIAAETALKLKETCAIHAEAYSVAEIMHGPLELVGSAFPVFAYVPDDAARSNTQSALTKIRAAGAHVLTVEQGGLPYAATGNPLLDPIAMIQTAYLAIEQVAQARNRNPDQPRLLKKVTETI